MAIKQRIGSADPKTARIFELRVDKFIWHFVWGAPGVAGIGKAAVIAAGWSASHAKSQFSNMIRNPAINARIVEERAKFEEQLKGLGAVVMYRQYERAMGLKKPGNEQAATLFLRAIGRLKERIEVDVGPTLEDLIDEALKLKE